VFEHNTYEKRIQMGEEGAREDNPTPQKEQFSKKEEGTITQIIS